MTRGRFSAALLSKYISGHGCVIFPWRTRGSCSRIPKIRRHSRAIEKICNDRKQQAMHYHLKHRVKRAEDDVVCDPNEQKPARPVAAAEQKHSTKDRKKTDEQNPDNVIIKRTLRLELGAVVCEPDDSGYYEYTTNGRD